MVEAGTEHGIARILVAIDASPHSLAALEASAELARVLDAELRGLYVEDLRLMEMTRLPFAREVDALSGESRAIRAAEMRRQLRAEAARARRLLERVAQREAIEWSFRTARGRVAAELLAAAVEADLVTLGTRSRSIGRGPGSTARTLLARGSRPVMVLRRGARLGETVHVLFQLSEAGWESLAVAAAVAEDRDSPLGVLLAAEEGEDALDRARAWLEQRGLEAHFKALRDHEPARLAIVLREAGCGLFVLPRTALPPETRPGWSLPDQVDCPLLVVGSGAT